MTSDQQIGMISQILTGGTGFGGMAQMPPSHASEFYRAVPQPNLLQTGAMAIAGAMGMQGLAPLPSVAPGQGIGEAMYATNVNAKIWERMQSQAVGQMAAGIGHDLGRIGTNLGVPSLMGMSTSEFQRMVNKGTGSALGMGVVGQLANMPAFQQLQGGNVMGTYQSAFANRHLFGAPAGFMHPLDMGGQERAAGRSMEINNAVVHSAYGTPNGGIGMLPNYNYTRGFSVNDLQSGMTRMQQAGRWGQGAPAGAIAGDVGKYAKMMESLGDVMGSRDMEQLQSALSKMTQGRWERADFSQISAGLRQLQGMAQVLGRSKAEMMQTMETIQGVLQGGVGIGASQIAMGVTAGGYGGFAAAANLSSRVYGIAAATGANRPEDINRITMQQASLQNTGMNSYAGRAMSMAAYMHQEGMVSDADYDVFRKGMVSGDAGNKVSLVNDLLSRKFGSAAAGMERLNDPRFMAMIRAGTGEQHAGDVTKAIHMGQSREWSERVLNAGRVGLGRSLSGIASQMGQTSALGGSNAVAEQQYNAVVGYFDNAGQGQSAAFLRSVYADAMARPGATQAQAYQAVMGKMRGNIGQEFWGGAEKAAQNAALGAGMQTVTAGGVTGAEAKAVLMGLRSTGAADKFGAAEKSAYAAALKQLEQGNGAGALAAGESLLSGVSAEARDMINNQRGSAKSRALGAVAESQQRAESLARFERADRASISVSKTEMMQSDIMGRLTDWKRIAAGGGDVSEAVKGWLGDGQLTREQELRRYYIGAKHAEKMLSIKTPEDAEAMLKEQKAIQVWDRTTKSDAAAGRGVPIDIAQGLSDSERGAMASASIRMVSMSAGIMNQAMADTGQGLRANTGQLALGLAEGSVSPLRMLGLSDSSVEFTGGSKSAIGKWVKKSSGHVSAMSSANAKVQAALEAVTGDMLGASDGGGAIGEMLSAFQAKVGSGDVSLSDSKTFDKFMGGYSNISEATQVKMRSLYDAQSSAKGAYSGMADHLKSGSKFSDVIESANAADRGQRAISRTHMQEAAGAYLDSGLSVVGAMGPSFFGGGEEKDAVMKLLGKKRGMLTKVTQADYAAVAKKFSSSESLSQLGSEGMDAASVLFRSAQRQFNKGGGDGKSSKVTGTLTIINGSKRETALVNMTSE